MGLKRKKPVDIDLSGMSVSPEEMKAVRDMTELERLMDQMMQKQRTADETQTIMLNEVLPPPVLAWLTQKANQQGIRLSKMCVALIEEAWVKEKAQEFHQREEADLPKDKFNPDDVKPVEKRRGRTRGMG